MCTNREIQREVKQYLQVENDKHLICLGDLNGRLRTLEPRVRTDKNGEMIEEWINNHGLYHLNQTDLCEGTYTYGRIGGPRSAIDHLLVNAKLKDRYKGMRIDENAEELDISDHNLIRSWYKIGRANRTS